MNRKKKMGHELTENGRIPRKKSVVHARRSVRRSYDDVESTSELRLNEKKFDGEVSLEIRQNREDSEFTSTDFLNLSDRFTRNLETLESRESRIRSLESQIRNLTTGDIPFETLIEEVKINYGDLSSIAFSNTMVSNFEQIDTIPVFTVEWDSNVTRQARNDYNEKLKNWLSFKLGKEKVEIREQ